MTQAPAICGLSALAEIAGCFALWTWLHMGQPAWVLRPDLASLALFAWLLTLAPLVAVGRAYAAHGGIYIARTTARLWHVEGLRPDHRDLIGTSVAMRGARIIAGPRAPA